METINKNTFSEKWLKESADVTLRQRSDILKVKIGRPCVNQLQAFFTEQTNLNQFWWEVPKQASNILIAAYQICPPHV